MKHTIRTAVLYLVIIDPKILKFDPKMATNGLNLHFPQVFGTYTRNFFLFGVKVTPKTNGRDWGSNHNLSQQMVKIG